MSGLTVLDAGLLSTIQDEGRSGLEAYAVSPSGAADKPAYRLANRIVGNAAGVAVIETTLGAVHLRAEQDLVIAVTGAPVALMLDDMGAAMGQAYWVRAGSELFLGRPLVGLRSYIAVRGGLAARRVLGSRSTDTLGHLGPRPLAAGDHLVVDHDPERLPAPDQVPTHPIEAHPVLDLLPGPRLDWMEAASAKVLTSAPFRASDQLDRVGTRFDGPSLFRSITRELASEAILAGALQLPPSGAPILFGPDHPTTGGYPVIGVLAERQLPLAAQLRPGQEVRFRWAR
ncbi:MAG: biotin-dependent carboxyltransferase family protein [Actinomycetota bacterium]|nr:biotin-dependent carboxyltransferase family protein [Actinomycetota bacterium]